MKQKVEYELGVWIILMHSIIMQSKSKYLLKLVDSKWNVKREICKKTHTFLSFLWKFPAFPFNFAFSVSFCIEAVLQTELVKESFHK